MLNKAAIQGRLTKDPELRVTPSGISVCSFSLACDGRRNADGTTNTLFLDCVAWRSQAEFVSTYLRKGSMVIVEGSLQARDWTTNDGQKRRTVELVADQVHSCGGRSERTDDPAYDPAYD